MVSVFGFNFCLREGVGVFWPPLIQGLKTRESELSWAPSRALSLVLSWALFGTGKRGHYERDLFAGGISRVSEPLNSLEALGNGRILLYFPQSGGSLKSLEDLNSLESLENGLF